MLGKNLSNMSLEDLQKAVMGGNPSIEPYQALAAIEKMVKGQKAQIAQTAQQQAPQGMVAQRTLAEAAALRNPYMASGLGAAPVASPVTSQMGQAPQQAPQQQAPQGMADGGMVSFQEGGKTNKRTMAMPEAFDNTIQGFEAGDLYAQAMAKLKAGLPLTPQETAVVNQGASGAQSGQQHAPPSRLPGTNIDTPQPFNNKVAGLEAGSRYADEMAKIKADSDAKMNAPMSGQAKALTYLSGPLAAAADVAVSPINAVRNLVRNPLDRSPSASYTPFSDARTMALADDFGGKALREMRDAAAAAPATTEKAATTGFEAQIAKQIADLESQTGRKLSDGAKDALRQQEMAKMLKGSKGVQNTANMATPDTVKSDKSGLPSAAAARAGAGGAGGAGTGSRGAANVGLGAAAGRGGYEFDFPKAQTTDERLAEIDAIKGRMGAKNAEYLKPMQEQLDKYSEDAKANKKNSVGDALLQAGLGMMAGKSQHAFQNIGEGGAAGLAAYRDSKKLDQAAQDKLMAAQNDMAKSRIALEKGDETAALTFANQGRQEMKDRATLQLQAQYYAGSNAAQMAQANAAMARVNALGGTNDDKHMLALTRVRSALNQDPQYKELAKVAAFTSTKMGQDARAQMTLMEQKLYQQLAPELLQGAGGNTMQTSPAGGGGGAKFLGFES